MFRPDLVEVWIFRVVPGGPELLLLRRAPGRILPGLWQCVTGSLDDGERIAAGALRELTEETGLGPGQIEAFYDLDQVNEFHEPSVDAILSSAVFAVRVAPDAPIVTSAEHDAERWVRPMEALELIVWPAYRESIARIERDLLDPTREPWFRLGPDGRRMVD